MTYTSIAENLGVNLWMVKRAMHWGKAHQEKMKSPSHEGGRGIDLWASAAA